MKPLSGRKAVNLCVQGKNSSVQLNIGHKHHPFRSADWGMIFPVSSSILAVDEIRKLFKEKFGKIKCKIANIFRYFPNKLKIKYAISKIKN